MNHQEKIKQQLAGVQGCLRINIIKRACTTQVKVNFQEDSSLEKPDLGFYSYFSFKHFTLVILK